MGSIRVGILALVLAASACSGTEQGMPTAQAGNDASTATTPPPQSPSATTSTKSARPRTIDLKPYDPCRILEKIRPELGLPAKKVTAEQALGYSAGSATCHQVPDRIVGPGIQVMHLLNRTLAVQATSYQVTSPMTVEGFPALLMEGLYRNDCYVGVDVADDQTFVIQWTITLESGKPAMSDVCAAANKAAAAAMKVLVTAS
jgi:hypothetical protein